MKSLSAWALAAGLLLGGCEFGSAPGAALLPPRIAYSASLGDTVGMAAAHPVQSTGGTVQVFRIEPALPSGFTLDSLTGLIAGTPATARAPRDYSVTATGPYGSDTAVIRLWAVAPYNATLAPSVLYLSPAVDTVGMTAAHPAFSLGGPVTSYALLTPLPAGLTLNASTGSISGTPAGTSTLTDYRVVASGPGGKDTATLRLAAVERPTQQSPSQKPSIVYDSPAYDTVGKPASHPVISIGGKVTSYAVIAVDGSPDSLPAGLSLNTTTGLISGTPQKPLVIIWLAAKRALTYPSEDLIWPPTGYQSFGELYHLVATGPGGKDTAALFITVTWYEGEVPSSPGPIGSGISLTVNLSASASVLKKMVVTLTSNIASDSVIRDTLLAGASGLGTLALSKYYALKPLRHWKVNVKTLDAVDSVVHADSVMVLNLTAGENRAVTLKT